MVRALQSARAGGASTVTASTTFDPSALVNALSDDQLARFRGIERAAVMSRIQFLVVTERQVRALRERLEQYSSVLDAIVEPDIHAAMERAGVAVPSDAMHSTHSMADSSTAPPEQ